MSRPALPRASSAMSGFFFCGSIDDPVLYASASRRKPNSSLRPQHDLLAEARQVHLGERGDEQRLGHEVAVGHRVERVVEAAREPEVGGGAVGVERQARAGERARAERRHVGAVDRVAPAVDVAGERPEVREEVVREQHRLGALQVRVPGEVDVVRPGRRTSTQHLLQPVHVRGDVGALAAHEQPQGGGDLVVAAAAGVELGAGVARRAR